ncbi:GNAT family N-acetyltransferase [Microvirga yunnanensis]|uniref:GNAT family N-acetyltransferase n=1 Tax=Microvirga yunnanensis TaxID=2953740 RepID=UPI0021CA8ED6|nr:GNAT family N-acetyltransferase [Microvirga sp. HBU65207]
MIDLRPARPADYAFAFALYLETIKPYASAWTIWVDEEQEILFSDLWRPDHTRVIVVDGKDVGWVEIRQTGDEIFLKQLYVAPAYQGRGIGTHVVQRLLDDWAETAASMALFVLKNNPAVRFYKRHGFKVVRQTHTTFVMRRAITEEPCTLLPERRKGSVLSYAAS